MFIKFKVTKSLLYDDVDIVGEAYLFESNSHRVTVNLTITDPNVCGECGALLEIGSLGNCPCGGAQQNSDSRIDIDGDTFLPDELFGEIVAEFNQTPGMMADEGMMVLVKV